MSKAFNHRALAFLERTGEYLKTIYLFGESDLPGVSLPTIAIALVLSGPPSAFALIKGLLWNHLHLLTFQIRNQIGGIEEDRVAKPCRPLPAGRLTPQTAYMLYYILFPIMWLASLQSQTLLCTFVYSVSILAYNEGGVARNPVAKNIVGAIGLVCYCWGTTFIFGHEGHLHERKAIAIFIIGSVFATTGHAQDFRDRSGDLMVGRTTLPLMISQPVARWSLAALIVAWTIGLVAFYEPPFAVSIILAALGLWTCAGFLASYDEQDDYTSYIHYGLWLAGGSLLPLFSRLRGEFA